MGLFVLYWRLLRYRVAVMIILFMLLGAAWHGDFTGTSLRMILAILALASSYVSATSINDIADEEIDRINHPGDQGRPLVVGAAKTVELWIVFGAASFLAVALSLTISPGAAGIVALSLLISVIYSLPPVRLSYRTFLAPLSLAVAYVGIPYWLGVVVAGEDLEAFDLPLMAALYLLFVSRIALKDFRDREGDAAYGKPTFLLKYGKQATCLTSFAALCTGDIFLVSALAERLWLAALLQLYFLSIMLMLWRLYQANDRKGEQLSIGVGARMGNGLLITLLGVLILANTGADWVTQTAFALALMALYAINLVDFLRHPDRAIIGYKG